MNDKQPWTWDFDGACAPKPGERVRHETFSLGIFQWIPRSGVRPGVKRSRAVHRVVGRTEHPETALAEADALCLALNEQRVGIGAARDFISTFRALHKDLRKSVAAAR